MGRCGASSPAGSCGCHFTSAGGITASGNGSSGSPMVLAPTAGFAFVQYTTSDNLPNAPTEGWLVVETDTDRVRRWDGGEWKLIAATPAHDHQILNGDAHAIAAGGDTTVLSKSVTNPWLATDAFAALLTGTCEMQGTPGDVWDVILKADGVEVDRSRVAVPTGGWVTPKMAGPVKSSGAAIAVEVHVVAVGGALAVSTFAGPVGHQVRAQVSID